jgi:hypothetical protein
MIPSIMNPNARFRRGPMPAPTKAIPKTGSKSTAKTFVRAEFGRARFALELLLVAIVKLDVCALLPGVTEAGLKLHIAFAGRLPHDRLTDWP